MVLRAVVMLVEYIDPAARPVSTPQPFDIWPVDVLHPNRIEHSLTMPVCWVVGQRRMFVAVVGEAVEDLVGGSVQMNGVESSFQAWIQAWTSASSSATLWWVDRWSLRLVGSANQRSTRFDQELLMAVAAGDAGR